MSKDDILRDTLEKWAYLYHLLDNRGEEMTKEELIRILMYVLDTAGEGFCYFAKEEKKIDVMKTIMN